MEMKTVLTPSPNIQQGRAGLESAKQLHPDVNWSWADRLSEEELAELEFDLTLVTISMEEIAVIPIWADKLLVHAGFCKSRREAQRKITEGAVYFDRERVETEQYGLSESQVDNGVEVRVGKRCAKVRLVGVPWKD